MHARTFEFYLAVRILVAIVVLGSIALVQILAQEVVNIPIIYVLIIYVLGYSLGSILLYLAIGFHPWMLSMQLLLDLSTITAITHVTGSYRSPLSMLYVLFIAVSGLILDRKGLFRLAFTASIFYGISILGTLYHWFPILASEWFPIDPEPAKPALYNLGLHLTGFALTAWLVSIPVETARRSQARARAEREKVRNLQQILQFIVENFPNGLILSDREGRILFLNRPARTLLERTVSGTRDPWWAALGLTLDPQRLHREEEWHIRWESPEHRVFDIFGIRYASAATGDKWLWIFHDVTDALKRQSKERAQDRILAVAQMAAGLAHEIKNPLAAIHGAVQLLVENPNADQKAILDILHKETQRLKEVVDHFVHFASPPPIMPTEFHVLEAVKEVQRLVQMLPDMNGRAIQWEVDVYPNDLCLHADAHQFKQILWNLIVNAVQAVPDRGRIWIRARSERDWFHLQIQDTGVGIPPERMAHLFQPFQDSSTGGLGLGLAIVYNIVHAHGGYIEARSQPGQGTRFDIWLPMRQNT